MPALLVRGIEAHPISTISELEPFPKRSSPLLIYRILYILRVQAINYAPSFASKLEVVFRGPLFQGFPRCENLSYFFLVTIALAGVWLLLNGLLALLFSWFYVIREIDRFIFF